LMNRGMVYFYYGESGNDLLMEQDHGKFVDWGGGDDWTRVLYIMTSGIWIALDRKIWWSGSFVRSCRSFET
jgi:hypothetical protein